MSQNLGTECRNFGDCFRTVRVEFSRLVSDSLDIIFETVFGQARLKFVDYFQTVRTKFSVLFSDSLG